MYSIKIKKRTVYFASWEDACLFCMAVGINAKKIQVRSNYGKRSY